METYRNILIVKSGALGDLIAGTTAMRAIRDAYPHARITGVANSLMNEVAPPGTLIDDLIVLDHANKSIKHYLHALKEIRRRTFDLAVNLRWSSEGSAVLCYLSGAAARAGSGPRSVRWMYTIPAPLPEGRRHEFLRHLDITGSLGIPVSLPEPFIYLSEEDRRFAAGLAGQTGGEPSRLLLIHPGASTPSKAWPPERFVELINRFTGAYRGKIYLTWGPAEKNLVEDIASRTGNVAFVAPRTTIGQLAALVRLSTLCVCNYSGVMNVGMAVKTPLVAIGCTSPEDWGPYGDEHRTVNAAPDRDHLSESERFAAMKSIDVESVLNVVGARWRELTSQQMTVNA